MIITTKNKTKTHLIFSTHFSLCLFHEKSNSKGDSSKAIALLPLKKQTKITTYLHHHETPGL